jgi:hypothetical protein
MNDFANDPVVLHYINILRELSKKQKPQMKIIEDKPTITFSHDPIETQIRTDFNNYIKKTYPEMAYVKDAKVKIKHIPDGCGLENNGVILKVHGETALVLLNNNKQAEYLLANLEIL